MEANIRKINWIDLALFLLPVAIAIGSIWTNLNHRIDVLESKTTYHELMINKQDEKLDKILDKCTKIEIELQNKENRKP